MSRPKDATALEAWEANWLHGFLGAGKVQYGLTWEDVALGAGCDQKSVRNYLSPGRPIPRRVAKCLIDAVRYSEKAQSWRKMHCCAGHENGDVLCMRRNAQGIVSPCDSWVDQLLIAAAFITNRAISAVVSPKSIDEFAGQLTSKVCRDAEISSGRRVAIEKAIRSFLNLNGERFASNFASEAMIVVTDRAMSAPIRDDRLSKLPREVLADFARGAVLKAVRSFWPDAFTKTGLTLAEILEVKTDERLDHKGSRRRNILPSRRA